MGSFAGIEASRPQTTEFSPLSAGAESDFTHFATIGPRCSSIPTAGALAALAFIESTGASETDAPAHGLAEVVDLAGQGIHPVVVPALQHR
jgi:hypothetical protein